MHEEQVPRDHRALGRELGIFDTDPLIGAGLPFWLPDGAVVRHALEEYLRRWERRAGYRHVYSPVLGKRELYEMSGHWAHYRSEMYPPMAVGGEELVLRPSLCPHHAVMFRSRFRNYRELPLRLAELGGMYRAELSGVLGGLTRVRAITLNDAHIFCAPDDLAAEVRGALELIRTVYRDLGIHAHRYRLSLPDASAKFVDDPQLWRRANRALRAVLDDAGVQYRSEAGEAAFYGPKIDVQVRDHLGREFTLSTVQVDFFQPQRFDLRYQGADGAEHRPVMIHRSVVGSLERAVAVLLEQTGGAFPLWLAPTQVVALPVRPDHRDAADGLVRHCAELGVRAVVADAERGTLAARVRAHRLVPYLAVIGDAEAAAGLVAVRCRDGRRLAPMPGPRFLELLRSAGISEPGGD